MEKRRAPARALTSKRLLKTLTDSPALPQFIQGLQAPVLKRLIDHVGLRDAGALIEFTTPGQMREIFDVVLWESLAPGQAEGLRPERFLEWLDAMLDVSPAFAAQRLIELGDTFLVLNFAPLITAIDRSVASEHQVESCTCVLCRLSERDAPFEMIGDYIVVGTHDDEWETVRTTLVELEAEDADFLHRILARCSSAATLRDFAPDTRSLRHDEAHERTERRERGGFVTPELARLFLEQARRASHEELAAQVDYDPVASRYFEQLAAVAASHEPATYADIAADRQVPTEDVAAPVANADAELRALASVLVDAQIVGGQQPQRLTGPPGTHERIPELQHRLDRLQTTHPDVFAARLGELVFLANVLMAGAGHQGARFTETEAAEAALACANLGLDWLLTRRRSGDTPGRAEQAEAILEDRPGLVRPFQVGWNLIQSLPLRSAGALLAALRADHVRDQLQRKRWMLDEVESALSDPDIVELIEHGEFEDVGDNLVLLSLVLDSRACQCLRALISDFPRYPLQLNIGFHAARTSGAPPAQTNASQHLTTLAQLDRIDAFLLALDRLIKV
jgi:hypothetical protein